MALHILENGSLDRASVETLSPNELSNWIWARLHDADTMVPDDPRQDVGQYYLIGAIYKDVLPETQAEVRRILERFVRQLEDDHEDWQGRPAHDLLLLIMELREPSLAPTIRRMAEREQFLQGDEPDEKLHARLVQALVFLGEKVTPDFWKRQAEDNPGLAFSGMLMHSLYQALDLLRTLDLDDADVQTTLYPTLRGLLASKRYSRDDVRAILRDMRTALPNDTYAFVVHVLPELGEPEAVDAQPDSYAEPRAVLGEKGFEPEPALLFG